MSADRDAYPSTLSISACSASLVPIWRSTKPRCCSNSASGRRTTPVRGLSIFIGGSSCLTDHFGIGGGVEELADVGRVCRLELVEPMRVGVGVDFLGSLRHLGICRRHFALHPSLDVGCRPC